MSTQKPLIIDCHGHVSPPPTLWVYKANLLSHRGAHGRRMPEITDEEIAGVLYSTLFAGHETTSTFMGNYVLTIMQHRDAWEQLKADPALIPNAVEEMLRFTPSVVGWRRKARNAVTVGGVDLPEGAEILMITGSANRDEAQFPGGEKLDILRENARSHLSFGYGIHYCLGFQLAKMECLRFKPLLPPSATAWQ